MPISALLSSALCSTFLPCLSLIRLVSPVFSKASLCFSLNPLCFIAYWDEGHVISQLTEIVVASGQWNTQHHERLQGPPLVSGVSCFLKLKYLPIWFSLSGYSYIIYGTRCSFTFSFHYIFFICCHVLKLFFVWFCYTSYQLRSLHKEKAFSVQNLIITAILVCCFSI